MSDQAIPNTALLDFSDKKLLDPLPENILQAAKSYFLPKELDLLQQAFNIASSAHQDQFRQEGSPYITHPVAVTLILLDLHLDVETVCSGMMHDVLEDSLFKKPYIENYL